MKKSKKQIFNINDEEEDTFEKVKITAHAINFSMEDNPITERARMTIWALGKDGNRYYLRQENCPVFCYLTLPKYINNKKFSWNESNASSVVDHLKRSLSYKEDHAPIGHKFTNMKDIYNYQGSRRQPVILIYFKNEASMRHCMNIIKKPLEIKNIGFVELKMCENSISMVRKILSLRKTKYAQWFEVEGKEIPLDHPERTAIAGKNNRIKEILIDYTTMEAIPLSKSKNWVSQPDVLSFDIETYSDNHKRMPNELCFTNVAYMIQAVAQTQGLKHTRQRFVILIGDCKEIKIGEATEVTVKGVKHVLNPDVKIYKVEDELGLIQAYANIVLEVDPDVCIGYNIMGYDYKYLDIRLGVFYQEEWPCMGRIAGKIPKMEKREWGSSAYGHNVVCNLQMDGRISVDLLPLIKRGYNFERYSLDFVCKYFLKRGKHEVKAEQMFENYEFMQAAKELKQNFQDQLEEKIQQLKEKCNQKIKQLKELWNELKEQLEDDEKEIKKVEIQNGIKKIRDENEKEIANLEEDLIIEIDDEKLTKTQVNEIYEMAVDRTTTVVAYGIEDAELVIDLFEKLNIWIELVELSSIVGVTITDLFTRGQQVRCLSQIYDMAMNLGFLITKRFAPKQFYAGGFVGEPNPGLYQNIICLDFSSLYPSIIIDGNMCYTTFIPKEYWDEVPIEDCNVVKFSQDEDPKFKSETNNFDKEDDGFNGADFISSNVDQYDAPAEVEEKKGRKKKEEVVLIKRDYEMRFVKKEILPGIVPQLLQQLINERSAVRAQAKVIDKLFDSLEDLIIPLKNILDPTNNPIKEDKFQTPEIIYKKFEELTTKIFQENEEKFIFDNNPEKYLNRLRDILEEMDTLLIVLDKRQLGLKVAANSMYGFLGAQNGMLPFIEIAMAVTGKGRELITTVNKYLKDKYNADIVYNDTDSSFVNMHLKTRKECVEWGLKLAEEISGKPAKKDKDGNIIEAAVPGLFGYILKMEFEKGCDGLFIKKKKYAYLPIDKNFEFRRNPDTKELVIVKKGIMPARRDNAKFSRNIYMKLLETILLKGDIDTGYAQLIDAIVDLITGKIKPREYLTVSRSLGAEYKNDSYFMKVFADELARVGKPMAAGERALYVIVKTKEEYKKDYKGNKDDKVPLGLKMRDIDMWEDSWLYYKGPSEIVPARSKKDQLKALPESFSKILGITIEKDEKPTYKAENIDYFYYIEHLLMNPLDQLFSVGYNTILEKYKGFAYQPQNSRAHAADIREPIQMICKIIKDHIKGGGKFPCPEIIKQISDLKQDFIDARNTIDKDIEEENKKVEEEKNKKVEEEKNKKVEKEKNKKVEKEKNKKVEGKKKKKILIVFDEEDEDIKITQKKVESHEDEEDIKITKNKNKKKVESDEDEEDIKITKNKNKVESDEEDEIKITPKKKDKLHKTIIKSDKKSFIIQNDGTQIENLE